MPGSSVTCVKTESGGFGRIVATCVGDDTDGSFPAIVLPAFSGTLLELLTDPGTPAPTPDYDVTLVDSNSFDRLQGVGADRHTSTTQAVRIVYSGTSDHPVVVHELLTLTIAGSTVNSGGLVITLLYAL